MTAYIIARINVTDWEQYQHYMAATPPTIEKYGGRFISRGGDLVTLEGPEETCRVVLLEFPSVEQATAFYQSPEYQQAKTLRAGAASMEMVVVEGI